MKKEINEVVREARNRFTIEPAHSAEKEDILRFFKDAYADEFNAADYANGTQVLRRWTWANRENPCIRKKSFPAWFCKDAEGAFVGHLGIIPVSVKVKERCYDCVWGRDMIVPPQYRGQGIASLLFDSVMKTVRDKTIFFLLAGLNDYAVTIYKKLGFIHLGYIPLYVRVLKPEKVIRKHIRNRFLSRLFSVPGDAFLKVLSLPAWWNRRHSRRETIITPLTRFDSSFDGLWERVSPHLPIAVKRDSAYLNWRFVDQPYWEYRRFKAVGMNGELRGYVVLRTGKSGGLDTGVVSDLFARPDDSETLNTLINFTIKYFRKRKLDLIRCDILNKGIERVLRNFGFIRMRSQSHFMVADINQDEAAPEFVTSRANWFISYADCDLDLSGRRQE